MAAPERSDYLNQNKFAIGSKDKQPKFRCRRSEMAKPNVCLINAFPSNAPKRPTDLLLRE